VGVNPEEIKSLMQTAGLDKRSLAAEVGVSPRTVEGWLSKRPPSRIAQRMLKILVRPTSSKETTRTPILKPSAKSL
jgi:DNA-binding transcriptional regulator YiaG